MAQLRSIASRSLALALISLAVLVAGCHRGTSPSTPAAGKDRKVLDYFLDNPKLTWTGIDSMVEGKLSKSTGKLEFSATKEQQQTFHQLTKDKPVPEAVRAVVSAKLPMKADAFAGTSSLTYQEAQGVVGPAESSKSGAINNPDPAAMGFVEGTMYRYGAIDVLVDEKGLVRGMEVDLARFQG